MIKRTLYFGNPAYLHVNNAQLIVRLPEVVTNANLSETFKKDAHVSIPIEDIGVVILDHQRITITQGLMANLLENNVALIHCNEQHLPIGLMLNLDGNTLQSAKFKHQINASEPLKKQLWQQTIQTKITNQAKVLAHFGLKHIDLDTFARNVKAGDTENHEARAAALYWSRLFSEKIKGFTRGRDGEAPNHLLNYGYSIVRALVARALVSSGLLPIE